MRHRTKSKGDIGLTAVVADLTKHGLYACLPISEHLPFDLVVVDGQHRIAKVQVKYRTIVNGTLPCRLDTSWSNSRGTHSTTFDRTAVDGIAIYCADTDECHYVHVDDLASSGKPRSSIYLRIEAPLSMQGKIRWAKDYRDPNILFGRVAER